MENNSNHISIASNQSVRQNCKIQYRPEGMDEPTYPMSGVEIIILIVYY